MKTHKFYQTEAEAQTFADGVGGTVTKLEDESFSLPPSFFELLGTSEKTFAVAVRDHAAANCSGDMRWAWNDALDGAITGVSSSAMAALDSQFRARTVSVRWMVTWDDGVLSAEQANAQWQTERAAASAAEWQRVYPHGYSNPTGS